MSTFSGIEMGKRSLFAHQQSIQTAGHNLSNSSTQGYSRQRVHLKTMDPLYRPDLSRSETPGQIGQGVSIESIKRVRDELLDTRIIAQTKEHGYWNTRDAYVLMMEQVFNEPEEISIRTRMDQFWDAWEELALYPESRSARQAILTRGETLVDSIHQQYKGLKGIQDIVNSDIEAVTKQVNDIVKQIADLNKEIIKVQAMGDNPNDLMDSRDVLTEKLSNLINITIDQRDPDEYIVYTAGYELVQGKSFRTFELQTSIINDGYASVVWSDSGKQAFFDGGVLGALIQLRDEDLREQIRNLDTMTMNFVDLVNEIHKEGINANGKTGIDFFIEQKFIQNVLGNYDRDGDGEYDSSYIFRITGAHPLHAREQIGLEGIIRLSSAEGIQEIPYYSTDMVADVVQRINNSGAEVVARLDRQGRLELKGTTAQNLEHPDFVIRLVEDTGHFLAGYSGILTGSGEENAFRWDTANAVENLIYEDALYAVAPIAHPSAWMEINQRISADIQNIAAGLSDENGRFHIGDNRVAVAIASIRNSLVMVGNSRTFDDWFADSVTTIGLKGEQASRALETQTAILKELHTMRDSISGVNIDEELADIIKFQHGYNAAAKFIATVNEMLDTVINRMGV